MSFFINEVSHIKFLWFSNSSHFINLMPQIVLLKWKTFKFHKGNSPSEPVHLSRKCFLVPLSALTRAYMTPFNALKRCTSPLNETVMSNCNVFFSNVQCEKKSVRCFKIGTNGFDGFEIIAAVFKLCSSVSDGKY